MRRIFFIIVVSLILYTSWPAIKDRVDLAMSGDPLDALVSEIVSLREDPDTSNIIAQLISTFDELIGKMNQTIEEQLGLEAKQQPEPVPKPELEAPQKQQFSIHNIEIGDKKADVEQTLGKPLRSSLNEYGVNWHTYHKQYQNFMMIAYNDTGRVVGLFTNQDLISSTYGIKLGTAKETVQSHLGKPLEHIRKGMTLYQFGGDGEFDTYQIDDNFITIFYDEHRDNTVTAIQIVNETLENNRKEMYGKPSDELKEGFEYQLFDLTNAARVVHGKSVLTWNDLAKETARKHSQDMADNNYFSHTNPEGQSPFDRMQEDEIAFSAAGENLATGQWSSIFAHEGLMNSAGHRKNILHADFELLGVGVAFNQDSQPFYTENFFAD